jgi:AraC family transcriptional regulator, regulatory protein of adaptative response / methylphosphotriester-DNA alkyltransferase methyltransferase
VNTVAMQRPETIEHRRAVLEDALAIMRAEYGEDLAIDDVARRIATSRRQLQRCFAELGDAGETTFRDCLTAIRMRRAAELLGHRHLSVRQVAASVGYRQPPQFAKAFRRHHRVPPSAFRPRARVVLAVAA